jgi:hypothetical protein
MNNLIGYIGIVGFLVILTILSRSFGIAKEWEKHKRDTTAGFH